MGESAEDGRGGSHLAQSWALRMRRSWERRLSRRRMKSDAADTSGRSRPRAGDESPVRPNGRQPFAPARSDAARANVLHVVGLSHQFGGVNAVDEVHWAMPEGSISGLIGPNGAGKSTLINVVAGSLPLQTGRIHLNGIDVSGWTTSRIAGLGLIRTFQVARAFDRLSVLENMLVASPTQPGESLFTAVCRPRLGGKAERENTSRALELLARFDLYALRNDYAAELSGGQRRLLELARSLMCEPKLLILDEPMAGVNPVLIARIVEHLQEIRSWGVSLLLVEHNLAIVEELCDSVSVMVDGKVIASGAMATLREDPAVIGAYLGG